MKLQDLQPDATVRGILPDALVTVASVEWHGSDAMTLVYRGPNGKVADEILYRHDEMRLEIVEAGRPWSFDGDGSLFRLVADPGAGKTIMAGLLIKELIARGDLTATLYAWHLSNGCKSRSNSRWTRRQPHRGRSNRAPRRASGSRCGSHARDRSLLA